MNKQEPDIDLNLDNYDLDDLLLLFKMSYNFTEPELKQAKKIVLQMHPDKSGLDKKYFIFFCSAYKTIRSIYDFRSRSNDGSTEYTTLDDKQNDEIVKNLLNNKKSKTDFNKWFNELFEKTKITDEYTDGGYGDWLKSEEDREEFNNVSKQDMDKTFEDKKKRAQSLVVHRDFGEAEQSQYELTRDKPEYYSSDVFSKLKFDDLKRAHVESVVPVTHEDYLKTKKFNNLQELQNNRNQKIVPTSLDQAQEFLKQKSGLQETSDTQRAFKLVQQDQKAEKANDLWWSNLRHLI
jgi:hypothetical protein